TVAEMSLRHDPLSDANRSQVADALLERGYSNASQICRGGTLVPVLGRNAFTSYGPSFSIFDASAAARGVCVMPALPPAPPPPCSEQLRRPPFVASFTEGRCIIGPFGYAVFSSDGSYAEDFCRNDGPLFAWSSVSPVPPTRLPGTVAVIPQAWSDAVFHWLLESIPRMRMLTWAGIPFDSIDTLIIRRLEPWHREALDLLGVPQEKVRECGETAHIQAERLLVPSDVEDYDYSVFPTYISHDPWVARVVAELVPDDDHLLDSPAAEHLYISRERATWRRILNEQELKAFLEARGFRTVFFEEMTLREKARALRQASIIVAPVGAGLAHLPMGRPGSHAIILYAEDCFVSSYWLLCASCDIAHVAVLTPSLSRFFPRAVEQTLEIARDLLVDLTALGEALDAVKLPFVQLSAAQD
ncbi:MAG TPA: glycosyltransferase family 61 protein, partial [Skermanella sp.]|nr:glycosyltransferase family 61 protein [Skermanella sp.]